MSDQYTELIRNAKAIITALQLTADYRTPHTYSLGQLGVDVSAGASGILGGIKIATELIGALVSATSVLAMLKIATELKGTLDAESGVNGLLDPPFIKGTTGGQSTISGQFYFVPDLIGEIIGASNLPNTNLEGTTRLLAGSLIEDSDESAMLNILTQLIGSCAGAGSAVGSNVNLYL